MAIHTEAIEQYFSVVLFIFKFFALGVKKKVGRMQYTI